MQASSSKYVSQQGKELLKRTIKSSNSQNKILEQNLMWKTYETSKRVSSHEREDAYKRGKRKRTISDDYEQEDDLRPGSNNTNNGDKNYWMKKLVKEEAKQPDRWGHNGFKELYPEDFDSDRESDDSSDSSNSSSSQSDASVKKKKSNKKKKSKSKKEEKRKKSKKHNKHKKHRRK